MATSHLFWQRESSATLPQQRHAGTHQQIPLAWDRILAAAHEAPDATAQRRSQPLKGVAPEAR